MHVTKSEIKPVVVSDDTREGTAKDSEAHQICPAVQSAFEAARITF